MSSYQALLSLSPADSWIGGDDDVEEAATDAAVSSYLSFDIVGGVGEEEYYHHPPEPAAALFHAEPQQAPAPAPPLFDTLQADYSCASGIAGSSSDGELGKQSQTDTSALSSEGLTSHDSGFMGVGGGGSRSLPAARKRFGGGKIAFKMRSEVDVLDDGYRWRKYGKKLVKNSPNPRNYYRCSSEGCGVKKRVERARDDDSFVITTYDGVHNHPAAPQHALRGYRLHPIDPPPPQPAGAPPPPDAAPRPLA